MDRGARYAIMAGMAIVTIIILVVLFNIIRGVFDGGDSTDRPESRNQTANVTEAAKSGQPVTYTIRGAVVGDEARRSIRITIDEGSRQLEVLQGYSDTVIRTERVYNTQDAYNAFAAALKGAGFTNNVAPDGRGDQPQVCPQGRQFEYEIGAGTSSEFSTWSTSCATSEGTFTGNAALVRSLFQKQIPNYSNLVGNVQLGS